VTTEPLYVVDSSVWSRLPRSPQVQRALLERADLVELCLTAPVILELGFSARDPAD
jgi:predicted nucleic acid-binding protein